MNSFYFATKLHFNCDKINKNIQKRVQRDITFPAISR